MGDAVPPERLITISNATGSNVRIEAYLDTAVEASALADRFGGKTSAIAPTDWLTASSIPPGRPLAFGRDLLITGQPEELATLRAAHLKRPPVLCIPAAMAFGTGEHATTAMCLRLLAEASRRLHKRDDWSMVDLGSGSGVLALAARCFGAAHTTGYDHDPHAVRTARENARLNGIKRVRFVRVDLLRQAWRAAEPHGVPLVTANLFSNLLIEVLPTIARMLCNDGEVIASGVLASQTPEVESAFARARLAVITRRRRGRWVAYLAQKQTG